MYANTAKELQGQLQKPVPFLVLAYQGNLIRGERELAGTDSMLTPPSVSYMGPCCRLNIQGYSITKDRSHWEGFSGNPSPC
jgi:hypothetical protein